MNNWLEGKWVFTDLIIRRSLTMTPSKHVAYGEGRYDGGGKCPDTHPKRIMSSECSESAFESKLISLQSSMSSSSM